MTTSSAPPPGPAVTALRAVQMRVEPGEVVGLVGPSGSRKSTLLKCLGVVLTPSWGHIELGGETVFDGDHWLHPDLTRLRREQIGFIFQSPYLLPFLSVRDKVALLAMVMAVPIRRPAPPPTSCWPISMWPTAPTPCPTGSPVGNSSGWRLPGPWSTVRRSCWRTSPPPPREPRAMAVMDLLERLAGQMGTSVIVVTHDEKILPRLQRIYAVRDGVEDDLERRDTVRFRSRRLRT